MNGKIAVGVLSGALLLSGLPVGISYGEPATITEPTVLELYWRTGHEDSAIESFLFDPNGGFCNDSDPVCGQITLKDMPLFYKDGTEVGRQHISCTVSDTTTWFCTLVSVLKDGPYTDKGQIVAIGVKQPDNDMWASVVGGSGAYENTGGHAFKKGDDGKVPWTLYLTP